LRESVAAQIRYVMSDNKRRTSPPATRRLAVLGPAILFPLAFGLAPAAARAQDASVAVRVDSLVRQMTLEEKVSQMQDAAPAIDRLGIPEYNWWNEALHGVARSGLATVFPQAIGLAATWDDSLIHAMATVISDEARAKHHQYVREEKRLRYQGLTIWSPNINIFRDPRWGRGQETYGEDPYLTGRIAVPFIRGLQGDDPDYLKTVATVKHFAVHSGPEPERHTFDAVASERDFRETYLPHFEVGIREAGAYSLMCAYNRLYGEPACSSELLLGDILRDEWGFDGYVVSDCGAIYDIHRNHAVVATAAEAAASAVRAGTELNCGSVYDPALVEAVERGLISETEIDRAVKRLFTARFRLGMFDPPERVAYARIPYDVLDQPSHRALAEDVTRASMVLLKNEGVLPLSKELGTIAVIGPNADQWLMLLGNYNGIPADPVTPLRGIREAVPGTRVVYARGSELAEGLPTYDVVPGRVLFTPDGQPGLRAEFYDGYEPAEAGGALFTRVDSTLDAVWRDGAPRDDMDDDDFAVRWTGTIRPERTGEYRLGLLGTSRYRLFLEDSLVVESVYGYRNEYGDPRQRSTDPLTLEAGQSYGIRVEAQESYGDAQVRLLWTEPDRDLQAEAVAAAAEADAVILFLGLTARLEGEEMPIEIDGFRGGDRTSIDLPATQQRLMRAVAEVGKPTVLVLLNGSALAVEWADENIPAILEAWYPGQAAGTAIADVLFGDYNPAGRLPVTFYRDVDDLPPFEDYDMEGRTYRYFRGEPLYPFGHGLSYTAFAYGKLRTAGSAVGPGQDVVVEVDVTNTGDRAGDEVVQLYVAYPGATVDRPIRDLRGFERVHLAPGETRTVAFTLTGRDVAYWDADADRWTIEDAPVRIEAAASSADIRATAELPVRPGPVDPR
jgi:beta-glucosidase